MDEIKLGTALESRMNVRYSVKGVEFSPVLPVQISKLYAPMLLCSLLIPALLFLCAPHAFIQDLVASLTKCAWLKLDRRCLRVARES